MWASSRRRSRVTSKICLRSEPRKRRRELAGIEGRRGGQTTQADLLLLPLEDALVEAAVVEEPALVRGEGKPRTDRVRRAARPRRLDDQRAGGRGAASGCRVLRGRDGSGRGKSDARVGPAGDRCAHRWFPEGEKSMGYRPGDPWS